MNVIPALRTAYRTYVTEPRKLLPVYFLAIGAQGLVQALATLAGGTLLAWMILRGNFASLADWLREVGPIPIDDVAGADDPFAPGGDPFADPGEDPFGDEIPELSEEQALQILGDVFTLDVILLGAAVALGLFVAGIVVNGLAGAARHHAVYVRLRSGPGVRGGVEGVFADWKPYVGLAVLETVVYATIAGVLVGALLLLVVPILGILLFLGALALAVPIVLAVRLWFSLARSALAVEDTGTLGALRYAAGLVRHEPIDALGYGVVAAALVLLITGATSVASLLDAPSLFPLVSLVVVAPVLDLVKTGIYAYHSDAGRLAPPRLPEAGLGGQFTAGFARGFGDLKRLLVGRPLLLAGNTALFVGALYAGWTVAAPLEAMVQTSIDARVGTLFPPGAFLDYSANNWQVSLLMSFGGIVFGIATLVTLAFNGFVFGVIGRTEADLSALLEFVAPHGILEIPALLFAATLGCHLGLLSIRYVRSTADRGDLADGLTFAYSVSLALLVLFVVAGFVEGFISPYYGALLGL